MIEKLLGKTLKEVNVLKHDDDRIEFVTEDGKKFIMYHHQDCCESVSIQDINGDLLDLLGSPILEASERSEHKDNTDNYDSCTWTFYHIATVKGWVTIRWFGTSNGYYSESVDFEEVVS